MGCLNEMFIEGKKNLRDGAYILAYRSKIWVFPDQGSMNEASKRMMASIRKETQAKKLRDLNALRDEREDVLQAEYRKNDSSGRSWLVIVQGSSMQHQMETSPLVKKVAQTLGVNRVTYAEANSGDDLQSSLTKDLKPGDPTWAYHGTSTRWLFDILKTGITPNPDKTNFDKVRHEDHIFLTMDPVKAMFHANTASRVKNERSRFSPGRGYGSAPVGFKTNGSGQNYYQPVILKVKIPDPALIDADYDVDQNASQTQYTDMHDEIEMAKSRKGTLPGDPVKISKNFGVFGYKGKILPQQITEVLIGPKKDADDYGEDQAFSEFDSFTPQQVKKDYAELYDLYGGEEESIAEIDLKDFFNNPDQFLDELRSEREEMERENEDA
jgi:hypothetical protein